MVKTLPARVGDMGSLPGLERSLEEERATHSDLIFPGTRPDRLHIVHGVSKSQIRLSN